MKNSRRHKSAKHLILSRSLVALIARAAGLKHEDVPERGSALLATLMIITGLTLLGLGFVAITQTESSISVNQKNYTQALQIAEATALRTVDWFQNPTWALQQNLMPENKIQFKVERRLGGGTYVGRYKDTAGDVLFDKPFRSGDSRNRFYGTEDNPDVWINQTTSLAAGPVSGVTPSKDFLKYLNISLFNNNTTLNAMDNVQGGVITDIRIYAPPIENGNVNTEAGWTTAASGASAAGVGFIEGGTRFGVATIRVTSTKYEPPCTNFPCDAPNFRVVATRTVKATVTEWPFPGPNGPLQTNANLNTSGNIQIHWGRSTAAGNMTMAKTFPGIPWANAYDMVHYEHGYDTAWPTGYLSTQFPRAATADVSETNNYLYELLGRSFPDPWWDMRARGSLNIAGNTNPIPYPYTYGTDPTINRSNWFQVQNQNTYPVQQNVLFPRIDYNFWKQLAQAADDEANIYYLSWVAADIYRDKGGNVRTAREWLDVQAAPPAGTGPKSVPGFYFFDTQNGVNPQNNAGGTLAPDIIFNGGSMEMKGFVYLNTQIYGTKGLGGYDEWVNMPGEPYRDIGYFEVQEGNTPVPGDDGNFKRADAAGAPCVPAGPATNCVLINARNGGWDYQDMDRSNSNAGKNGIFDFKVTQQAANRFGAVAVPAADTWRLVTYTNGCNPGVNCSEPHEPYLNLIYPSVPLGGAIAKGDNPATVAARRPKKVDGAGNPVTCVAESGVAAGARAADRASCTSNGYDRDGGLVELNTSLNGVLYTEGEFDTTGNAVYFGSVLAQGNASKAGNPDIYFDERLVKGAWPPGSFGFPRVYVSSEQTDQ